jgi:hypothetical protein
MILEKLFEENRRYSPIFGRGFSNHVSMGLIALKRMGADDERLKEFVHSSMGMLEPISEPAVEITGKNFEEYMGKIWAFPSYLDYYKKLHAKKSRESATNILTAHLPKLMPGLAGGAFHPLIRLAYSVEQEDEDEIIFSLAYFAASKGRLGNLPETGGKEFDPYAVLNAIRNNAEMRLEDKSGLIYASLKKAANLPAFASTVAGMNMDESHLPRIAGTALAIYLSRENIATLHAVTGTHAFRLLLPYMEDIKTAVLALWQAVCAVYVAVDAPILKEPQAKELPPWDEIKMKSIPCHDVHTIKLVYSCFEEDRLYNNYCYKIAALHRLSLSS